MDTYQKQTIENVIQSLKDLDRVLDLLMVSPDTHTQIRLYGIRMLKVSSNFLQENLDLLKGF